MRTLVYALAFSLGGAIGAGATELQPMAAHTVALGTVQGVAYYTVEPEGLRLVTTVSAGEATLRVISTLERDQNLVLLVPGAEGAPETRLMFERRGERLYVNGIPVALH